jgi:hypothetical protein
MFSMSCATSARKTPTNTLRMSAASRKFKRFVDLVWCRVRPAGHRAVTQGTAPEHAMAIDAAAPLLALRPRALGQHFDQHHL